MPSAAAFRLLAGRAQGGGPVGQRRGSSTPGGTVARWRSWRCTPAPASATWRPGNPVPGGSTRLPQGTGGLNAGDAAADEGLLPLDVELQERRLTPRQPKAAPAALRWHRRNSDAPFDKRDPCCRPSPFILPRRRAPCQRRGPRPVGSGRVPPAAIARPAWKVLRVLGNLGWASRGFAHETADQVRENWRRRSRWRAEQPDRPRCDPLRTGPAARPGTRIADVPIYAAIRCGGAPRLLQPRVMPAAPRVELPSAVGTDSAEGRWRQGCASRRAPTRRCRSGTRRRDPGGAGGDGTRRGSRPRAPGCSAPDDRRPER